MWYIDHAQENPGIFVFTQNEANRVSGCSISEDILKENDSYHSFVAMHPARGSIEQSRKAVEFSVDDTDSGVTARSRAELSSDGMTLKGKTV